MVTERRFENYSKKVAWLFVRNNSHKKWWKENDYREELPDYPERAAVEAIANAIIRHCWINNT